MLGVPVHGQSLTSSDLAIRLIPDPNRVRLALEVTGASGGDDLFDERTGDVLQRQRIGLCRAKAGGDQFAGHSG